MTNVFQTKRFLRIYGVCALSLSLISVALRLIGILFFFDKEIGYYDSTIFSVLSFVVPTITIVAAFVFCFIPKLKVSPATPANTQSVRSFSIFPAVAFLAYAIIYAVKLMDYSKLYGNIPFSYLFTLICTLAACVFFAMILFSKEKSGAAYAILGILTIFWFVTSLAECYFDTFVQMNSPNKIIFQFAMISAMLLTVNELRMATSERKSASHLFSATVAVLFLTTSSIPSVICYYANAMPVNYALFYSDAVLLLISIFAIVRLVQLCFGEEQQIPSIDGDNASKFAENEFEDTTTDESVPAAEAESREEENGCENSDPSEK